MLGGWRLKLFFLTALRSRDYFVTRQTFRQEPLRRGAGSSGRYWSVRTDVAPVSTSESLSLGE